MSKHKKGRCTNCGAEHELLEVPHICNKCINKREDKWCICCHKMCNISKWEKICAYCKGRNLEFRGKEASRPPRRGKGLSK